MRLVPLGLLGHVPCLLPADAARATGCGSLTPLHFPGGVGSTVREGAVPRSGRACWTVCLEAGRQLDLRLTSIGGGATLEVRPQGLPSVRSQSGTGSFTSSSVSSSSTSSSAGGGETRMSLGPQWSGGEFLIAVGATREAGASYRLEVTLR
jgi:hypothetical protein